MSFQLDLPPSAIAKMAKTETELESMPDTSRKREDYKKLKELEEARKAGTAPAMLDEFGNDINPHIPQYIMQAPWYYQANTATLRHQRIQEDKVEEYAKLGTWFKKGVKEGPIATKFRKGSCENCGSMTHKRKDCLERPRKKQARFTGADIAPDEYLPENLNLGFEGKRDQWNTADLEWHRDKVQMEHTKMEEAKRILKSQMHATGEAPAEVAPDSDDEDFDEDKYADDVAMPGQKFEHKQRITVRNLRIREDTAKYLLNLDVNSAHYDPKTRSMRQNPFTGTGNKDQEEMYAGDNFVRTSGDAHMMAHQQMFAWQAYEKGTVDVHLQADPTKLAMLQKEFHRKKDEYKTSVQDSILDKYGGEEHLNAPPKQLLMAQSENYVEYSRHGTILKGAEKAIIKSIYEEDQCINNHLTVWGSYWRDGSWGFKCCYSIMKESYCTGKAGREAAKASIEHMNMLPITSGPGASSAVGPTVGSDSEEDGDETTKTEPAMPPPSVPLHVQPVPVEGMLLPDVPLSYEVAGDTNVFRVGFLNQKEKDAGQEKCKGVLAAYQKLKEDAAKKEAGIDIKEEEDGQTSPDSADDEDVKKQKKKEHDRKKEKRRKKKEKRKRKKEEKKKKKKRKSSSSSSDSSESEEEDEEKIKEKKVKEAMAKIEKQNKAVDRMMKMDERKRPYNSMQPDVEPSEIEMEAYRRKQKRFDDPMNQFL